VKFYPPPEVKGVSSSIGGDFPPLSERRLHSCVGGEPNQTVKDISDGAAGRNVGRPGGVQGTRIFDVARVDQGAAVWRRRIAAATASEPGQEREGKSGDESGHFLAQEAVAAAREFTPPRKGWNHPLNRG
jgi:hypothetical protein